MNPGPGPSAKPLKVAIVVLPPCSMSGVGLILDSLRQLDEEKK